MDVQRHVVDTANRQRLQQKLMQDYLRTISALSTHQCFLHMMLAEVQRYQRAAYGVALPKEAMYILGDHMAALMSQPGISACGYASCVEYLQSHNPYTANFKYVAEMLVEQKRREEEEKEVDVSDSTEGVNDDDEADPLAKPLPRVPSATSQDSEAGLSSFGSQDDFLNE